MFNAAVLAWSGAGLSGWMPRVVFGVTVVLAAAWVAAALLARSSAAARHRAWSLGVLGAILLPVLALCLPEWRLGWFAPPEEPVTAEQLARHVARRTASGASPPGAVRPVADRIRMSPANDPGDRAALVAVPIHSSPPEPAVPVHGEPHVVAPSTSRPAVSAPALPEARAERPGTPAATHAVRPARLHPAWWSLAWALPCAWLLVQTLRGQRAARRVVKRAVRVADPDVRADVALLSRTLGVPQPPPVREAPQLAVPLCAGWRRACILLPAGWRQWSREQLRSVLAHELAHVARRDVGWQLLAQAACAAYWFHPLGWLAAQRMRREREAACDDCVLAAGQRPTEYARLLLDMAAEAGRCAVRPAAAAVAMASASGVERRIRAVLDPQRRRGPIGPTLRRCLATAMLAALLAGSTLSPLAGVGAEPVGSEPASASADEIADEARPSAAAGEAAAAKPESRVLAGRVTEEDGTPAVHATVKAIYGYPARETLQTTTAADGQFRLELPSEHWWLPPLHAVHDNGVWQALWFPQTHDLPAQPLSLALEPTREIEVSVVDAAHEPVAGAVVGALAWHVEILRETTDAEGRANLRLPLGKRTYDVFAAQPDVGLDYVKIRHPDHAIRDPNPLPPDFSGPLTLTLNGTTTVRVRVVDHEGRPLVGALVVPEHAQKPDKGGSFDIASSGWFRATTDAEGLATLRAIPADLERPLGFFVSVEEHFPTERPAFDPKRPQDELVVVQLPMLPVQGRVTFADGEPAAAATVRVASDSYHAHNFPHQQIQTDERGRFDLKVYPDQYYLFVADSGEFASPPHAQVIRLGQQIEPPELVLHPATRVHGRLTEGSRGRPAIGEHVTLHQRDDGYADLPEDQRLPNPRESRKAILPEIGRRLKTDADGRFEAWVGPGSYYVAGPQTANRPQFEIPPHDAEAPAVVEVNLHANRPEKGRLAARVVRHDDPDRGVPGASVHGRATVREDSGFARTFIEETADHEGRFEADRARLPMLVAAFNADRSLGAIVELDPDADKLELKVAPTASAVGQLVDARTGEPLADQRIEGGVRIQLDPTRGMFSDAFGTHATTDENGWFVLTGLVVGWEYSLKIATDFDPLNDRPRAWQDVGKGTAEKAMQLELEPIRVRLLPRAVMQGARARSEFRSNQPVAARFQTALRDARLGSQRLLLLFGSADNPACRQFFELRYDADRDALRTALGHYVLLPLDVGAPAQAVGALAERLGVTLATPDGMTLAVLDADERLVAQTTSRPLEAAGRLDADRLAGFLARHAPDLPDAEELFGEALARARRENKRVLVQYTGPGEVLLARFLDDHGDLIETDYVWLRTDMRFPRGDDVIRRLGRRGGSFPWMAILDARGTPLIDSIGPDGSNIGFPRDAAGIEHFGNMLRTTRRRLTDAEIQSLLDALPAALR